MRLEQDKKPRRLVDGAGPGLLKKLRKTSKTYGLLAPDDRIMVAISGGKDSHALLSLLMQLRGRLPFSISLVAVHLDQKQPGYDGTPLFRYLEGLDVESEVLAEDTYSVVLDHVKEGGTYCSMCSRLRRGILYTAAERLECNKIALGHHRDDALQTFLMNLFYAGKMQAMPAKYTTDDGRFEVIRPLIECAESEIAKYAVEQAFPILPCNLCGSQPGGTKREAMDNLLAQLEATNPNVRAVMLNALRNVRPTHLLDQEVLEAWDVRPEHVRPKPPARETKRHSEAQPVLRIIP